MRINKILALALISLLFSLPLSKRAQAAAGDLDASFGNGGKVITDFSGNSDIANAVAIQQDGKIVAAGGSNIVTLPTPVSDFAVTRYNPDGSLDASFGVGGKVITDFGEDETAAAITIQQDGKIIVAGTILFQENPIIDFLMARYNPDGSLDKTFGDGAGSLQTSLTAAETASTRLRYSLTERSSQQEPPVQISEGLPMITL